MDVAHKPDAEQRFSDKESLRELIEEIDAKAGICGESQMTAQELRAMLIAQGIRPEDNLLSRDIIRTKYPDEEIDEV